MRSVFLVVSSVLFFSSLAHGQEFGSCALGDQVIEQVQNLRTQQFENIPSTLEWCGGFRELSPETSVYQLTFRSNDEQQIETYVFFEVNKVLPRHEALVVALIYEEGSCVSDSESTCTRGWINDNFVTTGHKNPTGTWTSIQESSRRQTRIIFYENLNAGLRSR